MGLIVAQNLRGFVKGLQKTLVAVEFILVRRWLTMLGRVEKYHSVDKNTPFTAVNPMLKTIYLPCVSKKSPPPC